jgi:phosphoribosylglycinamide formyltransferase-1
MKKIVILASGSGTLAQAIFDAVQVKTLACEVAALISDRVDAGVITRAQNHGVPVHLHPMTSPVE